MLGASALLTGGIVIGTAVPASAADFPVTDLAELLAAVAAANANGQPDTITFNVGVATTFNYNGSLQLTEDLAMALAPGSAAVELRSIDNDAVDVDGVSFTATDIAFRGGTGAGILGTNDPDISLFDCILSNSTGAGISQNGGTLYASGLTANGNGGAAIGVTDFTAVTLFTVDAANNGANAIFLDTSQSNATVTMHSVTSIGAAVSGVSVSIDTGTVTMTGIDGNDGNDGGIAVSVDGGTAHLADFQATGNPTGVYLRAFGGASMTLTGADIFENDATGIDVYAQDSTIAVNDVITSDNGTAPTFIGGGVRATSDGADLTFNGLVSTGNTALHGGGFGIERVFNGGSITIGDSTIGGNRAIVDAQTFQGGTGGGIGGVGPLVDPFDPIGSDARLTIERTTISGNTARFLGGGIGFDGVEGSAVLTIVQSTIADNDSLKSGGGVSLTEVHGVDGAATDPMILIDRTTISNNEAVSDSGGLTLFATTGQATARIVNSTVSGNISGLAGAMFVIAQESQLTLELANSTVYQNVGGTFGGAYVEGADILVTDSILAGNDDADLAVFTGGSAAVDYSLVQVPDASVAAAVAAGNGNLAGIAAGLGPLAPNGGPTLTHLLLGTSPAIGAGDPAFAPPPSVDQRSEPRVMGRLDMGAVEVAAILPATGGAAPWWMLVAAGFGLAAGALVLAHRRA
jgi:LPXTG-motif cell wall-anchored protein